MTGIILGTVCLLLAIILAMNLSKMIGESFVLAMTCHDKQIQRGCKPRLVRLFFIELGMYAGPFLTTMVGMITFFTLAGMFMGVYSP